MTESFIPLRAGLLDKTNPLDRLIISMSEGEGRAMELIPRRLEKLVRLKKYPELFQRTTVKNLFRDLQAYWIIKVFKNSCVSSPRKRGSSVSTLDSRRSLPSAKAGGGNDKHFPKLDDDMKLWLSYSFLTGAYKGQYVGDLLSAYLFAYPGTKVSELISRDLLFSGGKRPDDGKKLMQKFDALSKEMHPAQLMQLIENASSFGKPQMEDSVIILLDRLKDALKTRPDFVDRKKITASCVDVLIKRKDMFNIVLGGLQKAHGQFEKLKAMMDMNYVWNLIQTSPEQLETFFTRPKDITFGMRMAGRLAGIGIVDKDIVSQLFKIIKSNDYDVYTRASIVRTLGEIEYGDNDAREYAAELLAGFLKGIRADEWRDTMMHRMIFNALIALGKIGIAKTKEHTIPNIIAFYLYDVWQPYLRLAAARALSIMARTIDKSSTEFKNIKMGLTDALADEEELVRRVAYNGLVQLER